jgi:predicted PurR-regulated permease PerM
MPSRATVRGYLLRTAAVILLAYLAYVVREIWLPLILAFLLAMVLDPVVDRMELRGWSRQAASAFIFCSFLLIVGGLLVLAFPLIAHQADMLEIGFARRFPDPSHGGLLKSFRSLGLPPWAADAAVNALERARASLQKSSDWITNFGLSLVTNGVWLVIVPIVAFYALRDFHTILAKALILVPAKRRDLVQTAVTEITSVFGKYLRGLGIVSALNGAATAVLLAVLQVPGAVIVGVVAGILYSVPYVGALLTIVVTGAFAFVGGGPHMALLAVGSSLVLHQIVFDQIVTPRILGGHVGLHPILSIFALLVGNLLLGIVGMVLAVPVAACVQIAVLALIPKLSRKIEIGPTEVDATDTVASLEQETKEADQAMDATQEIHASVISAVESIEHEAEIERRDSQ